MSAVEALAEVLREHECRCGLLHPKRLAAALVAAIRSMPAEQVAELIGGEVAYWTVWPSGAPYMEILQQGDYSPERIITLRIAWSDYDRAVAALLDAVEECFGYVCDNHLLAAALAVADQVNPPAVSS